MKSLGESSLSCLLFYFVLYTNRTNVQKCKLLTPKKGREDWLFPLGYKDRQDNTAS